MSCCRRGQSGNEDVMLSASAAPSRRHNAPLSPFGESSVSHMAMQMSMGAMTTNFVSTNDFGAEMFSQMTTASMFSQQNQHQVQQMLATPSQLMDEISDGGATNDSDRNSSPFYQETSDYDEDFVPMSSRGRGRGSGKKKPGRGQSSGSRRQTNPGPTGFFSATNFQAMGDFPQPPPTRGKRGKRGNGTTAPRASGKGPGRGRGRGRGSAAQLSATLQQMQFASTAPMSFPMYPGPGNSQMLQMSMNSVGLQMMTPSSMLHANASISSATNSPTIPPVPLQSNIVNQPSQPVLSTPVPPAADDSTQEPVGDEPQDFRQEGIDAIREVDETFLEDEDSRHSGTSRTDEVEYTKIPVVCRANDEFLQKAPLCLVCGSIGKGAEASMVACSNCAQTYHTYCITLGTKKLQMSSAVLNRGWRCLDCTICEGCGNGTDEEKLLLCDECDVSYHVYCMKPPLEKVPEGPWRCQWCSRCRRCKHKATGNELNARGLCIPCASLQTCPRCNRNYQPSEKIIRCSQCSKWQHGACENLHTDEQLEQAAMNLMRCSACRPTRQAPGFSDADTIIVDNVALSKDAHEILKSKYNPSALKNHMLEASYRDSFDHYEDDFSNMDDPSEPSTSQPAIIGQRGRGRGNPSGRRGMNRIGVGGFYAKLPRHRIQALSEEAAAAALAEEEDSKKTKRPRKPRRSQLEDAYPSQIQEAFFGIKAVEGKTLVDVTVEEPVLPEFGAAYTRPKVVNNHFLSKDATDMLRNDINENELLEGLDINMDAMDFDFSLLIDDEAEYNEELEDSLQGDSGVKEELPEGSYGPTTFNLEQRPSTSNGISGSFGQQATPGMNPANFAQNAPGVRMAIARSGSQSDAPDRYQFSARWEEDEPAGLMATTAAVLYSNEKHPYLKQQFPNWTDRVKQIQKLWRNLNSDERQEYVNRARDNRTKSGSKPRPRRVNVNSTNSVDSPTSQSPAVGMSEFKVPMNPGIPTTSTSFGGPHEPQAVKKVHVTNHLPQELYQQWQEMRRVRIDRERLIASLEEQLVKSRKQKKNLAAKRRQMQRTQQAAPDYDGRPVDLNDTDQMILQQLTDQIKATQAEIDNSRRDLNTRKATMAEFEQSHRIIRNESDVSAFDMEQTVARDNQYAAQMEHRLAQQAQAQGLGMVAAPHMSGSQPSIHLPMLHQQQMMQMQGMRPGHGFMMRQPGMQQMALQQQQEIRRMMQMRPRPTMGNVRLEDMTDPVMRDVYLCLDAMISDVHTMLETPREAQHALRGPPPPHILQRMMPHNGGPPGPPGPRLIMPGHIPQGPIPQLGAPISQHPPPPTPQSAQPPQLSEDGPKPKKKRATQKKATSSYPTGGEYDAWIETMRTRFRLCPEVPKVQKEPQLGRPSCEYVKHGMTDMLLLRRRKPLLGEFGSMTVKRGTRLFGSADRKEKAITFNDVNLYQVEPPIRLVALYNTPKPETDDDVIQDEMDEKMCLNPNSVISRLFNKKHTPREHIRCLTRYMDEASAPVCPESSMFMRTIQKPEDEMIELVFNTSDLKQESTEEEKNELSAKHLQQIKKILSIKEEIEWKMEDTPPESPVCSTPEPEALEGIRQTTSTSRAPSASVEKEIKREDDEDVPASSILREIKKEDVDSSQPHECKQCHKVIDEITSSVRVTMAKLGILNQDATPEEKDEMVSFCSKKCYYEIMSTGKAAVTQDEMAEAEQYVSEEILNKLKQNLTDSIVKAVNQGKKPAMSSFSTSSLLSNADLLVSPRDTRYMMDEGKKDCVIIVPVSTLIGADSKKEKAAQREAAGEHWKAYTVEIFESFVSIHQQHQQCILAPKIGVPHPVYELDKRICIFCGGVGDGDTSLCGRLIALTEFYWVHVNCALWSSEVFEHEMGILSNVERAVIRAAQTPCDHCKLPGASVKCHKMNCGTNYHVTCARNNNGYFVKDRTFICKAHEKVQHQVYRLDALRKIYIKRDENKMLMRLFDLGDGPDFCLKLGAFTFYKLGSINPTQLKKFHNKDFIFPDKYRVTRFFWSPRNVRERMLFECTIEDRNNQPVFVVKSLEDPSIAFKASSPTKAWWPIFDKVNKLREVQPEESLRFFGSQVSGESLFGLTENTITKITESLPGFDTVFTYQHRHQNSPVLELPLPLNPMGCARAEPRSKTVGLHFRNKPEPMGGTNHHHHGILIVTPAPSTQTTVVAPIQLDTLQSRQASTSLTSANSGRTRGVRSYYTEEAAARARAFGISPDLASLSLRMETSQSSQTAFSAYQKMRREWKERVYLARSRIAGLGLYAKNDISMGEFIIEYKGEIIRSEVCECREIRYTAENRGVYMFRIDEEFVIDATMAGGPARYINHSCDPNCSTQILDAGSGSREKKIIITANRPISSNEELTYDYQFELEGTTDKIPCLCGAPNCVKWMN